MGYKDGVHYIKFDMDNFKDKVDYYLEHEEERKKIADNGRKKFLSQDTVSHRLDELSKIFTDICV